jgi:hypothetical protein
MVNTGSDVALNENGSVRVVFSCEDEFVTFQFFLGVEKAGDLQRLSRTEAAEIGKRVAETGIYHHFPISGVSLNDVRTFGLLLRRYGEEGK